MNRLRETVGISNESKLRLAATYAIIKQNSAGLALLSKSMIDEQNEDGYYYYYGSVSVHSSYYERLVSQKVGRGRLVSVPWCRAAGPMSVQCASRRVPLVSPRPVSVQT